MLGTLVDIQIGYPLSMWELWEPYCSKGCELNEIMQGERTREREVKKAPQRGQQGNDVLQPKEEMFEQKELVQWR